MGTAFERNPTTLFERACAQVAKKVASFALMREVLGGGEGAIRDASELEWGSEEWLRSFGLAPRSWVDAGLAAIHTAVEEWNRGTGPLIREELWERTSRTLELERTNSTTAENSLSASEHLSHGEPSEVDDSYDFECPEDLTMWRRVNLLEEG